MPEPIENPIPARRKSSERTEAKFFEDAEKIIAEAERLGAPPPSTTSNPPAKPPTKSPPCVQSPAPFKANAPNPLTRPAAATAFQFPICPTPAAPTTTPSSSNNTPRSTSRPKKICINPKRTAPPSPPCATLPTKSSPPNQTPKPPANNSINSHTPTPTACSTLASRRKPTSNPNTARPDNRIKTSPKRASKHRRAYEGNNKTINADQSIFKGCK